MQLGKSLNALGFWMSSKFPLNFHVITQSEHVFQCSNLIYSPHNKPKYLNSNLTLIKLRTSNELAKIKLKGSDIYCNPKGKNIKLQAQATQLNIHEYAGTMTL